MDRCDPRGSRRGPGQESVWDYPRPPRLESCSRTVTVEFAGETLVRSERAWRLLETAGPPTIYVPVADVQMQFLVPSEHGSFCEWKGAASYYDVVVGDKVSRDAAWFYASPNGSYAELKDHVSFYPGRVDAAYLGDERVRPQPGNFYGGWITDDIVGPFKGDPGSGGW